MGSFRSWMDLIFLTISYVWQAWLKITQDIIKDFGLDLRALLHDIDQLQRGINKLRLLQDSNQQPFGIQ